MDTCTAFSFNPESVSQEELDAAWLTLGAYKLSLRKLCFESKISLAKVMPELRRCNARITELWDEILKRQVNFWYYGKAPGLRTGQKPEWNKNYNFMRWMGLPTIFTGFDSLSAK